MAESSAVDVRVLAPLTSFFKDSFAMVDACEKPNREEFLRTALVTGAGFVALGVVGFVIKYVHLQINSLLVG